ncbi:MAG: hypothetical protein ACE37H_08205 [Phycisphaeraceae bacterium]
MIVLWVSILLIVGLVTALVPVGVACLILKSRARDGASACIQCGYPKRGSESATCPECGFGWRSHAPRRTRLWQEVVVLGVLIGFPFLLFVLLAILLIQVP